MWNTANVEFRQPGTKLIVWHHAGQAHVGVAQELQDRRVGVGGTDQYNLAVAEAISHARQQLDVDLALEVAGIADGLARVALECVELSTGRRTGTGWIYVAAVGNKSDIRADRKSVGQGQCVSVRVELGGRRSIKKTNTN